MNINSVIHCWKMNTKKELEDGYAICIFQLNGVHVGNINFRTNG